MSLLKPVVIDQDVTSLCGHHHLQVSVSKLTFEKYSLWTTYQSTVLRVNFSQLGKLIKLPMFAVGGKGCRTLHFFGCFLVAEKVVEVTTSPVVKIMEYCPVAIKLWKAVLFMNG